MSADVSYRIVGEAEDGLIEKFASPQLSQVGSKIGWNDFTLKITISGVQRKKWYDFITNKDNYY